MTDIWVRHDGSDCNTGYGDAANTAYRTISKAIDNMSDTDNTVYVKNDATWKAETIQNDTDGAMNNGSTVFSSLSMNATGKENQVIYVEYQPHIIEPSGKIVTVISPTAVVLDRTLTDDDVTGITWRMGDAWDIGAAGTTHLQFTPTGQDVGNGEYRWLRGESRTSRPTIQVGTGWNDSNWSIEIGGNGDGLVFTDFIIDGNSSVKYGLQNTGSGSGYGRLIRNVTFRNCNDYGFIGDSDEYYYLIECTVENCPKGFYEVYAVLYCTLTNLSGASGVQALGSCRIKVGNVIANLTATDNNGNADGIQTFLLPDITLENTIHNLTPHGTGTASAIYGGGASLFKGIIMRNVITSVDDYGIKNNRGVNCCISQNDFYDNGADTWADSDASNLETENLTDDPRFTDAANGDLEPNAITVRESDANGRALGAVANSRSGPAGSTVGSPISGAF